MIIEVDPQDSRPVYVQIMDSVRRAIATGALRPGDRLPGIREVAVQARVNRNTVSRAYLELEHQGLVRNRQGSGAWITDNGPGLTRRERLRLLKDKADALALEAYHFRIPIEEVLELLQDSADALGHEATGDEEGDE